MPNTQNEVKTQKSKHDAGDNYDYGSLKDVSWFSRLLWFSAGADAQLLMRCPMSDRVKYQGLGGVVLSVGMLAFFSGSYAFYAVFSPKDATVLGDSSTDISTVVLSIIFGIFWAMIIYNLDRFIVSSTGKGDGTDRITLTEFLNALPRLLMALIIGLCLSKPLEIKILESEIKAQLELEQNTYLQELNEQSEQLVTSQRAQLREKMDELQSRIDESDKLLEDRRLEINQQRKNLELEAEGKIGSGFAGRGPAWQDKKDNLDRMQSELDRDRSAIQKTNQLVMDEFNETKQQLSELDQKLLNKQESNKQSARHLDGLLKRIQISHEIGGWVPYAIMLLLLCIEAGPIFFKLMLTKGAYDYLEENQKKLACASMGIEPNAHIVSDDKGNPSFVDEYHSVKHALYETKLKVETEQMLANQVHNSYRQKVSEDISANPEKYIES